MSRELSQQDQSFNTHASGQPSDTERFLHDEFRVRRLYVRLPDPRFSSTLTISLSLHAQQQFPSQTLLVTSVSRQRTISSRRSAASSTPCYDKHCLQLSRLLVWDPWVVAFVARSGRQSATAATYTRDKLTSSMMSSMGSRPPIHAGPVALGAWHCSIYPLFIPPRLLAG